MENCVKEFGHSLGKEGIKPKETGKKSGNLFFLKSYPPVHGIPGYLRNPKYGTASGYGLISDTRCLKMLRMLKRCKMLPPISRGTWRMYVLVGSTFAIALNVPA